MLYSRDYRILTHEEKSVWDEVEITLQDSIRKNGNGGMSVSDIYNYWDNLPLAVIHYKSLFPNNYINSDKVKEDFLEDFKNLINQQITERGIQSFIREKEAYSFIAKGILWEYSTGHHGAYVFKEFPLPPNFIADYLIVGKNSGGYSFIFVELENVHNDITTKNGDFGSAIRKGLKQIDEWDTWLDANFSHLKLVFEKAKSPIELLPNEFIELDKSRIHYVLVSGRRSQFNEKTYRLKRKLNKDKGIVLLHYDNLIDNFNLSVIRNNNITKLA